MGNTVDIAQNEKQRIMASKRRERRTGIQMTTRVNDPRSNFYCCKLRALTTKLPVDADYEDCRTALKTHRPALDTERGKACLHEGNRSDDAMAFPPPMIIPHRSVF